MGSIQPGMLTDLVIFNGNIMDVPIERVTDLKPVFTLVGGSVAYESDELQHRYFRPICRNGNLSAIIRLASLPWQQFT